ncbi:MAG: hypothetical protein Q9182_007317 [Xanthomendoza sp. 2 TL-2023]
MEATFIDALVKACSCRQQSRITSARKCSPLPPFTYHRTRRRYFQSYAKQVRNSLETRIYPQAQPSGPTASREEYIQLLDYYRETEDTNSSYAGWKSQSCSLPFVHEEQNENRTDDFSPSPKESNEARQSNQSDAKNPEQETVSHDISNPNPCPSTSPPDLYPAQENTSNPTETKSFKIKQIPGQYDPKVSEIAESINRFLHVLEDGTSSHEQIYETYCQLPSPGVRQISRVSRRLLFHRLSVIESKTRQSMLRYLRLVDDMKEALIPLSKSEWNTAIAYAGQCYVHVDALQVETALRIWKELEQEAGVRSGPVTFNILFDTALRAQKFVLAEMILKEMDTRGLKYSRYSHVSFIYYHGLRGDGAGIRKAYRDLVEAGQIVDTVVMNCVMASLIRAGELPAAEQVYERMKRFLHAKTGQYIPPRDWRYSRELGQILDTASRKLRNQPQKLAKLQAQQYLAPDIRTFSIFIDYHVHITGELRRITVLLAEMQDLQIPIQGRMFVKIFRGFARHGGVKYTSWTTQKLEAVWMSLLAALDRQIEGIQVMKWIVVWVVRAFAKCCGKARALQVWEEIRDRWNVVDDDEKGAVEHLLREVLR